MIQPNSPEESAASEPLPFQMIVNPDAPKPTYKPYGEIIQLDWTPQENIGGVIIPKQSQAKMGLPFFKVKVLAAGPDVKLAKAGTWVLLPQQVILHAKWSDDTAYFSSESKILGVVE